MHPDASNDPEIPLAQPAFLHARTQRHESARLMPLVLLSCGAVCLLLVGIAIGRWFLPVAAPQAAETRSDGKPTEPGRRKVRLRSRDPLELPFEIGRFALSPDGKHLVLTTVHFARPPEDAPISLHVYDLASRQEAFRLTGHERPVVALAFSPDGKWLASCDTPAGGEDGRATLKLWNWETQQCVRTWQRTGVTTTLAFSPDGRRLVCVGLKGDLGVQEVSSNTSNQGGRADFAYYAAAFTPDSQAVLAGFGTLNAGQTSGLDLYREPNWSLKRLFASESGVPTAFTVAPDGQHAACGLVTVIPESKNVRDSHVVVWEAGEKQTIHQLRTFAETPTSLAFSSDVKLLAATTGARPGATANVGSLYLWDVTTGELQTQLHLSSQDLRQVSFSRDGQLLLVRRSRRVHLWDVSRGD